MPTSKLFHRVKMMHVVVYIGQKGLPWYLLNYHDEVYIFRQREWCNSLKLGAS
jgi:hypothetical protein